MKEVQESLEFSSENLLTKRMVVFWDQHQEILPESREELISKPF